MLPAGSMVEPERGVLLMGEKNPVTLPFLTGENEDSLTIIHRHAGS